MSSDTQFSAIDHAHMARALRLAERGLFTTQPNPRVGCVLAHGAEIVGEGWHERAGQAHAEVHALRAAGDRACDATAYVTLEPCAHFGKTPPCADALVGARIARVVVATGDSFAMVAGRGVEKLRDAGIVVDVGLMASAAREINRGFFARIERSRPWLRLKLAMSLDGRTALANGQSKWITGEAARADVQHWRARSSAIVTGVGSVLADDPRMTVRLPDETPFVAPLRVVVDTHSRASQTARIFDRSAPTLIYCAQIQNARYPVEVAQQTVGVDPIGRLDLSAMLEDLAWHGANEVQVEAGATLSGALLRANLVDELLLYIAPCLLGDRGRPLLILPELTQMTERSRWQLLEQRQIGEDIRLLLRPRRDQETT